MQGTTARAPYVQVSFTLSQPLDHSDPNSSRFDQRLELLHLGDDAPVVLETEGYDMPVSINLDELSPVIGGNQLHIEHRFFGNNPLPRSNADWQFLSIAQAAADDHAVVMALKKIFKGPWLNTGASKGGETAVYHRRFYPNVVVATVAYVSPLVFGLDDQRFIPFMAQQGTPACHAAVNALMRRALQDRASFAALVTSYASGAGETFSLFPPDEAWETTVTSLPFTLWQYFDESTCDQAPEASASNDQVFQWISNVGQLDTDDDYYTKLFAPYDYQVETELGAPAIDLSSVADLLLYQNAPDPTLPADLPRAFDASALSDVAQWITNAGDHLLFVYGQNDPWTAGAVTLRSGDNLLLVAPNTNHDTADLTRLAPSDRAAAVAALSRWLKVPVATPTSGADRDQAPRRRWLPKRGRI